MKVPGSTIKACINELSVLAKMSEDFFHAARQEIEIELHGLKKILECCRTDEDLFRKSKNIEYHFHKIRGLAPMMGQERVGKLAKMAETIIRHVISNGSIKDSYKFILEVNETLNTMFHGKKTRNLDDIRREARKILPQIYDL